MKLELEVLASTNIKRKKAWPKIVWVGEEKESLLLLDNKSHRLSVLYVPSGNTKRRINKLSPLLEHAEIITTTKNGRYVIGFLKSGEVFIWHKDQDILKSIHGLETIVSEEDFIHGKTAIFSSNDCKHIIVILGTSHIYIWNREQTESVLESKVPEIRGTWNLITVPTEAGIPNCEECPECSVEGIFFTHQNLGFCSQISFAFNKDKGVSIVTVLLSFNVDGKRSLPPVNVEWTVIHYPLKLIHPSCKPVYRHGAFITKYADNGQVIAVAANQENPMHTGVLFASPLCDTVLPVSLNGCGSRDPYSQTGRNFWVSDMEWTCDSLFLACSLQNGCVCLLTRLGEPLVIQIVGKSLDMGPSHFLPLHPLLMVRGEEDLIHSSPNAQKFSISTHPSLPIILFSDGFMVTVVQFKADVTCLRMMKKFVLTSAKHLKEISEMANLDVTLTEAFKLPSERDEISARSAGKRRLFQFEEDYGNDHESETSFLEENDLAFRGMNAGKIEFSEGGFLALDSGDFSGLTGPEILLKHMELAESALFSSWKLATSYTDTWTSDIDKVSKQIAHNFTKLFTILLECRDIDHILSHRRNSSVAAQNPRLFSVVTTYKRAMELLRFDIVNKHLLPVSLKLSYETVNLVLTSTELQQTDPRLKTLSGCYALLKFTEEMLNKVYTWSHHDEIYTGLPLESRSDQKHAYEPAVLRNLSPRSRPITNEVDYSNLEQLTGVVSPRPGKLQQPGKKLCGSWKLLYRSLTHYQKYIQQQPTNDKEQEQLMNLMFAVEQNIRQSDGSVPKQPSPRITQGEHFSLGGKHTMAIDAWREELQKISEQPEDIEKKSQVLHAVLYTHLLKDQLLKAIDFVDELIIHSNVMSTQQLRLPNSKPGVEKPSLMTLVTDTIKSQHTGNQSMVPCIRDKAVRQLVQSMARFMSSYFCNQPVYILPPHSAQPLPCIHLGNGKQKNNRIIPKYHEDINNVISKEGLSKTWTTDRAMEYLLLSGLLCEATWFADKMGDWKAGLLLSVACINHRIMSSKLYKKKKRPLMLPDNLSPGAILQDKLEALIHLDKVSQEQKQDFIPINNETNIVQLTKTMEDLLKAGVIGGVEILPWLLSSLVERLKNTVSRLHPLVPQGFYLPSPPLYCPQPSDTSEEKPTSEVDMEKKLRFEISSMVQLILVILNASHVSLPATRWYIQQLVKVQEKAAQFKATTEGPCSELPEILEQYNSIPSSMSESEPGVVQILTSFRDFTTTLWLLHARDTLSKKLRQKETYLNNVNYQDYVRASWDAKQGDKWMKECFNTLQWAVHMLAFSRFLPEEECVYKIALSLIQELKPEEDTADILAEHFHDEENLDSEVQDKLNKIIQDWQGVTIEPEDDGKSARPEQDLVEMNDTDPDNEGRKSVTFFQASPRGKTLSVYFFKQCEVVMKILKKRRKAYGSYEEFVFDSNTNVAYSITSSLTQNNGLCPGSRPFESKLSYLEFLDSFVAVSFTKIVDEERERKVIIPPLILPFAENIWNMELENLIKRSELPDQERKQALIVMSSPKGPMGQSPNRVEKEPVQKGMFRSVSVSNEAEKHSHGGMSRFMSEGGGLNYIPENELGKEYNNHSPNRMKGKMTGMVSKFAESEEVLYRDPSYDQEKQWSLDVDLGKRYHHLQNVLHWFSVWGKKQHSLGLEWKGEKDLSFRPKMKIDAPVELVVLTIWLLDNKYSPYGKPPSHRTLPQTQKEENIIQEQMRVSVSMKESAKMLQSSGESKRRYPKPKQNKNVSLSLQSTNTEKDWENEYDIEAEEVHTEYEKVLDVKEDSSSIEVSSLEPEEYDDSLRNTLSYIKKSGSLNQRKKSPRRERSSESRRHLADDRRRRSPDQSIDHERQRSRERYSRGNSDNFIGNDLAHQLQDIVRGELRKIMEAQHRSMLAMMGALDGHEVPADHYHNKPSDYRRHQSPRRDLSPRRRQDSLESSLPRRRSPSNEERRRYESGSLHRRPVEEHMTQSMVMGELSGSRRKKSPGRANIGGTLKELQNLQENTNRRRSKSPHGQGYRSEVNKENYQSSGAQQGSVNFIPKFLRMQAERDEGEFKLPHIPIPAWEERGPQQPPPGMGRDFGMPLLQLNAGYAPSQLFPGSYRVPQAQYPPPPPPLGMLSQPPNDTPLAPMYQNMFQRIEKRENDGPAKMDMPLLSLPKHKDLLGPSDAAFGRLLDPHLIISHEQEIKQKELLKHKHNLDFLRSHVENLEDLEKQEEEKGKQLLSVNLKRQEMKDRHEDERIDRGRSRRRKPRPQKPAAGLTLQSSQESHMDEKETPIEGSTEEAEGETSEDQIHDGYAIRPGSYENYLHMDKQMGFEEDTNARIQYRTAMIMKKQRRKKVDFSTMTHNVEDAEMETDPAMEREYVRTAEASTCITKDTGVDPIQEAIVEYNRARQGNALPPDIYLGLRFGDTEQQPTSDVTTKGREKPNGRSYLNVVDLDASALLHDLHEKPDKEEKVQRDLALQPTSMTLTSAREGLEAMETTLREALQPKIQRPFTQDAVTVRMFESKAKDHDRVSVAVMPRESLQGTRASIIQRLRDMNSQIQAIDHMSDNIERGFHGTRMLISTLEHLADTEDTTPGMIDDRKSETLTPKVSQKSPKRSARSSARTEAKSTARRSLSPKGKKTSSQEIARISGLSGISDIIGEMVQKGDIDLEEAGFEPEEAKFLVHQMKHSARRAESPAQQERMRKSLQKLEEYAKAKEEYPDERSAEKKEEIRRWMADKRAQKMEEYRKHLQDLREHEVKPFKPSQDTHKGTFKASEFNDRKFQNKVDMTRRMQEAEELFLEALRDKPELPPEPTYRERSPKRKPVSRDTSPLKTKKRSPERWERSPMISDRRGISPGRKQIDTSRTTVTISPKVSRKIYRPDEKLQYREPVRSPVRERQPRPQPIMVQPAPEPVVPRLRLIDSDEFMRRSQETTGDYSAYAKAVADMEVTQSQEVYKPRPASPPPKPAGKQYKQKSFTEMVRLQDPSKLKKKYSKIPTPYAQRLASMQRETPREHSPEEKGERIYGSNRSPSKKSFAEPSPRTVKTYAERLQEMKSKKTYSTPIIPRSHIPGTGRTGSSTVIQKKKTGPPHKPMTYVEQLQKLNQGAPKTRGKAGMKTFVKPQTFLKSHKPLHKSQTYSEQLQTLQPPKAQKKISPARTRAKPYPYPYSGQEQWEGDSVVSSWSVDDRVNKILYGDEASTVYGSRVSFEYPMSDDISDYLPEVMGESYVNSVDIDEIMQIADVASVGSGDVMSVIDWDAVDELITDVH
ncbi:uncharacterized protein LOC127727068 isoform X2 [Mytilus californianus]|uniref:uncharacterized protein LOC127727068 isoform X2 n=1 Tax=Mytilus californianus TaxID=6549 RepID=UPI002245FADC|nr:uncharacterized protein LOC127727068 isoform X2 [Mytilus californianus]